LTGKKGDKTANARPGNKNAAKGPRLGRKHKPVTNHVAAPALPQLGPGAKLVRGPRRGRGKTGGRDFASGTNSHDGTVFRRTKAQLPRGNGTLMLRIGYHDFRDKIYDSIERLVGTPMGAAFHARVHRPHRGPARQEGREDPAGDVLGERELAGLRRSAPTCPWRPCWHSVAPCCRGGGAGRP
jgi:hypothetical protein